MSKYNFFSKALFSAILLVFVSCSGVKKDKPASKEAEVISDDIVEMRSDQVKLARIETGTVELRSLSGTLKVSGVVAVSPQNQASVCVPMGGFVKSTDLVPGRGVSKGQTLAIIENQEFIDLQQQYLENSSKLEYIEAEYNRQKDLFNENISAAKTFQQTTSDYKSLQSQVKALEQKLALIGINPANLRADNISRSISLASPITGYVKAVNVNIGKYVSPSDVLFEIVNSDKLFLELTLFEKDADKVSLGQKIRFFINNETEQHDAIVYLTGKSINSDKTYKVYANVTSICRNILPGMYVNAIIQAAGSRTATLPSEAIVSFDDKDYIFIFEKNKEEAGKPFTEYRMIQVQKGISDGGYTEITLPEGINITDSKIVIKGAYNLLAAKKNAGEMAC